MFTLFNVYKNSKVRKSYKLKTSYDCLKFLLKVYRKFNKTDL